MSFGLRLKELRNNAGMTQEKLAEGVTTKSYISQMEKGIAKPSTRMLEKLSLKLNCSVEDFFQEPENNLYKLVQVKQQIQYLETKIEDAQFNQVKETLEKVSIEKKELNSTDLGILFWVKGEVSFYDKEWETAVQYFNKSIDQFTHTNFEKRIKVTNSLAKAYLKMEKNEQGLQLLTEIHEQIMRLQIKGFLKQSVLINLGIAHGKVHEYHSAIRLLKEAYYINQSTDLHYRNGEIFMSLGICYKRTLQLNKAKESYKHSLIYFDLNCDQERKAGAYFNLALLFIEMNHYEKAIEYLLLSLNLFESLRSEGSFYLAKIYLADTYRKLAKYEEAIQQCSQVLTLAFEKEYELKAHIILGDIQFDQENFKQALGHYLDGDKVFTNNDLDPKDLYKKIANSYYHLKEFEKAASYFYQYNSYVQTNKGNY